MIDDSWEILINLANGLPKSVDPAAELATHLLEDTIFELYMIDLEIDMFIAAANCIADRYGLAILQVELADGEPEMILSFGVHMDQAKNRFRQYCEEQKEERSLWLEEIE